MSPPREWFREEWHSEPFDTPKTFAVYEDGDGLRFYVDDGCNDDYGVEVTLSAAGCLALWQALDVWGNRA